MPRLRYAYIRKEPYQDQVLVKTDCDIEVLDGFLKQSQTGVRDPPEQVVAGDRVIRSRDGFLELSDRVEEVMHEAEEQPPVISAMLVLGSHVGCLVEEVLRLL